MGFGGLYAMRQQALMAAKLPRTGGVMSVVPPVPFWREEGPKPHCRHRRERAFCVVCKPIHTSKDRLWRFPYTFRHGDTQQITSKGQFLRACRQRKLKWTGTEDLLTRGQPSTGANSVALPAQAAKVMEQVIREAKQPALVEKKWAQVTRQRMASQGS